MTTILVTGGIGSGKSEVCRYLSAAGHPVYDCDSRCKSLYDTVPGLKSRIEKELKVPFDKLQSLFGDAEAIRRLEGMVFPYLLEDIARWKGSVNVDRCFIESATAMDKSEFDGVYDEVWLVEADYHKRLERNPKVAQRSHLQHFDASKATRIIRNDGTLDELHKSIENIL